MKSASGGNRHRENALAPEVARHQTVHDHERSPAVSGEEPTRRSEEEPVDRSQRGTLTLSTENSEFVPKNDNFQLFEVVRPNAQRNELEKPTEDHVTERDMHDASCVAHSTHGLLSASRFGKGNRDLINAPFTLVRACVMG